MTGGAQQPAAVVAPQARRDAWLGIVLVLAAAVAWSTMGLFVRAVPVADVWTVVFWRSIFGGLSIAALAMIEWHPRSVSA
jgi:drug/metabolite transporter (DMT)-like permease